MSKPVNYANLEAYVEAGVIAAFWMIPFPMAKGWSVHATGTNGQAYFLESARHDVRRFAAADTAIDAIRGLGWHQPITVREA